MTARHSFGAELRYIDGYITVKSFLGGGADVLPLPARFQNRRYLAQICIRSKCGISLQEKMTGLDIFFRKGC